MPKLDRKEVDELDAAFNEAYPAIVGPLSTAASHGLKNLPEAMHQASIAKTGAFCPVDDGRGKWVSDGEKRNFHAHDGPQRRRFQRECGGRFRL